MRLYRITAKNDARNQTHWVGSQAEASAHRKQLTAEGFKRAEITTEELDVPTDKKGLLDFLNNGCEVLV